MPAPNALSESQRAALERLVRIAQADTGQSRRVASFLLAWWNAEECGGFDLTDLWGVDTAIAADMVTVFALVASRHSYPDTLGYSRQFQAIVRAWRPALK
jgi:predicted lipid carrier protein YhbT